MKIVERCFVAPHSSGSDSLPPNTLVIPLSFLDIFWLPGKPVKRVFLYKLSSISTPDFVDNILPNLKHSLSICLQHFFPAAGSLVVPASDDESGSSSRPYIRYEEGYSVGLTVGESDNDFDLLLDRSGKLIDAAPFHELVPSLAKDEVISSREPLLALQVTVFPNSGICVGISYKHVLGDGRSIMNFLKTWSAISRNNGALPEDYDSLLPSVDRSLVPDPGCVLQDIMLKQLASVPTTLLEQPSKKPEADDLIIVRATFVIKRCEIDSMRHWILSSLVDDDEKLHLSSFVLVCSLIWISLVKSGSKSEGDGNNNNNNNNDRCYFGFTFDCCNRYEYHSVVPPTYFGNCLSFGSFLSEKRTDLEGPRGFVVAVKAIGKKIQEVVARGPMKDAEKWMPTFLDEISSINNMLSVAGSPRLDAYGLDFGWGRPEKIDVVSIEEPKAIALAEARDDEGGVEVGLALELPQMEAFVNILEGFKSTHCRF